jgi:hypothetical protein
MRVIEHGARGRDSRAVKGTAGPGYGLDVQITAPAQRTPTR